MQKRDYNQGRIHRATEFQLIIHKKRLPYGDPESPKKFKNWNESLWQISGEGVSVLGRSVNKSLSVSFNFKVLRGLTDLV